MTGAVRGAAPTWKIAWGAAWLLGAVAAAFLVFWTIGSPFATPPVAERSGQVFRDCSDCPQMLVVPPGTYAMGWEPTTGALVMEWLGLKTIPRRVVTIGHPFAVGRYEVTFDEWDACVADGGCGGYRPSDDGWGRGSRPVIHVSWNDAHAYVRWLSAKTGATYRLLTEAEWEYAARAGTTTAYPWGMRASHEWANYGQEECCHGRELGYDKWLNTAPVGQFPANGFGLHDMIGNVYEWVEDCHLVNLERVATDGSVVKDGNCGRHVMRGAAWYSDPGRIRAAYRAHQAPDKRGYVMGFRVAKSL